MTRKIFIPILTTVALAVMTSCGGDSPKSRISHSIREISHSMREHTEQTLQPGESFEFIGLSNQRDTIYMGVTRQMRRSHLQNQRLHHRDLNPPFRRCHLLQRLQGGAECHRTWLRPYRIHPGESARRIQTSIRPTQKPIMK